MLTLGAYTINVAGSITNSAAIDASSTTLVLNGSAAQAITGAGTWNNYVSTLTINNSANSAITLNSSFAVYSTLNLTNGVVSGSGIMNLGMVLPLLLLLMSLLVLCLCFRCMESC